jgi:SPX domain protein involved in polyphosphate accumulation
MANYHDNLDGKSQRMKIRIRWYGNLFGAIKQPVLEIKTKNGYVGNKLSFPLETIVMNESLSVDYIQKVFNESKIPGSVKLRLRDLKFSLLNCYKRKYFLSCDKKFRITIDSDLRFLKLSPVNNIFSNVLVDHSNTILELKYEKEADMFAERITNYFPFRMTKSSKYVSGIELLNA